MLPVLLGLGGLVLGGYFLFRKGESPDPNYGAGMDPKLCSPQDELGKRVLTETKEFWEGTKNLGDLDTRAKLLAAWAIKKAGESKVDFYKTAATCVLAELYKRGRA